MMALRPDLDQSFQAARQVTQVHAKSFYFSSFPLPRRKRLAAYTIYAFCRYCDDVMDESLENVDPVSSLSSLQSLLEQLYNGSIVQQPLWATAFQHTVKEFEIPRRYFDELIRGMEFDSHSPIRIQTWNELREYCYYVASVVGLMMSCIFGLRDDSGRDQAIAMGLAMQLTNILRDVHEDLIRDRIYLPMEELKAYDLNPVHFEAIRDGELSAKEFFHRDKWKVYAAFWISRTHKFYEEGERGIPFLVADGSQFCVRCMRHIYAAILNEIEHHRYDVSERRKVGFMKKVGLVGRAFLNREQTLP